MEYKSSETAHTSAQTVDGRNDVHARPGPDADGFSEIHRHYRDRLIDSLTGFVRDRGRADEIAADTFQVAWEKRGTFHQEASLTTWIESIGRNLARDALRRDRRSHFDPVVRDNTPEIAAPGLVTDDIERRDDQIRLQSALNRLPGRHRRVLVAHFVEGLSMRDIAARERVPVGTVLSRAFTAKQLLRHLWEANEPQVSRSIGEPEPAQPSEKGAHPERVAGRRERETNQLGEEIAWDR